MASETEDAQLFQQQAEELFKKFGYTLSYTATVDQNDCYYTVHRHKKFTNKGAALAWILRKLIADGSIEAPDGQS